MPRAASQSAFSYRHCTFVAISCTALGTTLVLLILGAGSPGSHSVAGPPAVRAPRIVVIKHTHMLHLFDGDRLLRSYPLDLGTSPAGEKRLKDDGRTPLGRFRIVTKNVDSPYHRFLGISYPHAEAVDAGLTRGLISPGEASAVRDALAETRRPIWDTALGGGVGIHGGRRGYDWTGGCIALSDKHITELFGVLRIGDVVEILP